MTYIVSMNKVIILLICLMLLSTQVFALTAREKAINTMLGNPLRKPILSGSDVIITKNLPTDSFWFYCVPIKNFSSQFSHSCFVCKECN